MFLKHLAPDNIGQVSFRGEDLFVLWWHCDPTVIAVLEGDQEAFNIVCLITSAIIAPLKQVPFPATKSWELLNHKESLLDMLENLAPNKNAESEILQSYLISICGLNIFWYLMHECYMKAFFLRTPYSSILKRQRNKNCLQE